MIYPQKYLNLITIKMYTAYGLNCYSLDPLFLWKTILFLTRLEINVVLKQVHTDSILYQLRI